MIELFGALENALGREVDAGKTPLRTIGAPRMGRAGVIARFQIFYRRARSSGGIFFHKFS